MEADNTDKNIIPNKKVSFIVLAVLLLIFIYAGKLLILKSSQKNPEKITLQPTPTITPTPDPLSPKNILLLGYGGGKHEGGMLTDTIIVVRIIPKKQTIFLISIPRDIYLPLPLKENETVKEKINAAYAIGLDEQGKDGGANLVKYAVSTLIGSPVDNYIALSFTGFTNSIDILGGVDVNVPYAFEDEFYPLSEKETDNCGKSDEEIKNLTATFSGFQLEQQFTCRFEKISFEKGMQKMNGETALKYVRSRHSVRNDGDFGRSIRQQALIQAVKNRIFSLSVIPKIIPLVTTLSKNTQTDIDISKLPESFSLYQNLTKYQVYSVNLSDQNVFNQETNEKGIYVLVPKIGENNWEEVQKYIEKEIEEIINPAPSPTITPKQEKTL